MGELTGSSAMVPPDFRVDVEDDGTVLVLRLHGELDLASVPTVERAVGRHGAGHRAFVVDLSGLDFMDSSGVRFVVQLRAHDAGTEVAFVAPGERVGRVLEITGVGSRLTWVTDPREVLAGED